MPGHWSSKALLGPTCVSDMCLQEECESDSVKAEKARARAHRDRLAQMAMERRAKKAEEKAEADTLAAMQVSLTLMYTTVDMHLTHSHACST